MHGNPSLLNSPAADRWPCGAQSRSGASDSEAASFRQSLAEQLLHRPLKPLHCSPTTPKSIKCLLDDWSWGKKRQLIQTAQVSRQPFPQGSPQGHSCIRLSSGKQIASEEKGTTLYYWHQGSESPTWGQSPTLRMAFI